MNFGTFQKCKAIPAYRIGGLFYEFWAGFNGRNPMKSIGYDGFNGFGQKHNNRKKSGR